MRSAPPRTGKQTVPAADALAAASVLGHTWTVRPPLLPCRKVACWYMPCSGSHRPPAEATASAPPPPAARAAVATAAATSSSAAASVPAAAAVAARSALRGRPLQRARGFLPVHGSAPHGTSSSSSSDGGRGGSGSGGGPAPSEPRAASQQTHQQQQTPPQQQTRQQQWERQERRRNKQLASSPAASATDSPLSGRTREADVSPDTPSTDVPNPADAAAADTDDGGEPCGQPGNQVAASMSQAAAAPPEAVPQFAAADAALSPLIAGVRAHESALSAAIVLEDDRGGQKVLITASLDKTVAAWRLMPVEDLPEGTGSPEDVPGSFYCEVQKLAAPGGPFFSVARSRPLFEQPTAKAKPASGGAGRSPVDTVFFGNAAKAVVSWRPFTVNFNDDLRMDGHTGWVRAVASHDKYLFSAGCNILHQWDCTYATPKEVSAVRLFTGDILCICAGGGVVYTGGADGSLRAWSIDRGTGALSELAAVEGAHKGRVVGLRRHKGRLYSASADGVLRAWCADDLAPVAHVGDAAGGGKLHCMAFAGNGVLYTGGDDCLIRAWDPATLTPLPGCEPLAVHTSAVRMLAAGKGELLVSGDAEGYVQFLRVPPPPAPTPALPRSYHAVTGPPASKGPSAAGGTASAATAQNGRRASAATVGVGEAFAGSVVGGAVVGGGVTSGTGGGGSSNVEAPLLALSEGQSLLRDSDDSADSVDFIPQRRETMSAVGFSQELSPADDVSSDVLLGDEGHALFAATPWGLDAASSWDARSSYDEPAET